MDFRVILRPIHKLKCCGAILVTAVVSIWLYQLGEEEYWTHIHLFRGIVETVVAAQQENRSFEKPKIRS